MIKALELTNLVKKYDDFKAVNDITFCINKGEVFGLLGENGAGKSTTISCIASLEKVTSGKIKVFNYDVQREAQKIKLLIGLVPQEIISHGFFNVEEILQFQSGYYGIKDNTKQIEFLLKKLFLWDVKNKLTTTLSGGMKRRLLIAKALVHKPKLLLLDEPTAGVDVELRQILWEFIKTLQNDGISVLLTTHYLEEAEQLCDRVAILNAGELVCIGSIQDLIKDNTLKKVVLQLKKEIAIVENDKYSIKQSGLKMECLVPNHLTISELLNDLHIKPHFVDDIEILKGNLEDVFIKITKQKNI